MTLNMTATHSIEVFNGAAAMKHNVLYAIRVLRRRALTLATLAMLLFSSAGTTHIVSIRAYLVAYATFLAHAQPRNCGRGRTPARSPTP